MIVGIIGLGLIGGSMAIDLKRRGFARIVLGVEADPVNAAAAERMELVDEIVPFEECVRRSDITVIAIPVGSAVKMLPQVLDIFKEEVEREEDRDRHLLHEEQHCPRGALPSPPLPLRGDTPDGRH